MRKEGFLGNLVKFCGQKFTTFLIFCNKKAQRFRNNYVLLGQAVGYRVREAGTGTKSPNSTLIGTQKLIYLAHAVI